jgi:PKD repeat protein
LDGSNSTDPDNNIVSYEWDLDADGEYDDASGQTATVTFADDGTFLVGLRVTDEFGESDTDAATITVLNVSPAIGEISLPASIIENAVLELVVNFTDPGTADVHTVSVDWGDGHSEGLTLPTGDRSVHFLHLYLDDFPSGTSSDLYAITIQVIDDDGGEGIKSGSITIENVPPVVIFNSLIDEAGLEMGSEQMASLVGLQLWASGSFSDVGTLDTHTATVDWGDGNSYGISTAGGNLEAQHVYNQAGEFEVRFMVTDDDTGVGEASWPLQVVTAAGAVAGTLDMVNELIAQTANSDAIKALLKALAKLQGNNDGRANNGALDKLEDGDSVAALVKIKQALEFIVEAEMADPLLSTTTLKSLLVLTAKSVAIEVKSEGEALLGPTADIVLRAEQFIAEGDTWLAENEFVLAAEAYLKAVQLIQEAIEDLGN